MAPSYIAAAAVLITTLLTRHGQVLNPDDVANALQVDIAIIGSAIVMVRQWWTGRATVLGGKGPAAN
jgi:hypothetical protein